MLLYLLFILNQITCKFYFTDPKFPAPAVKPSKCGSNPLIAEYRDACYQIMSAPQSQQKAEEACKDNSGHLVSIVDSFEQAFLYNFIGEKASSFWSGLETSEVHINYLKLSWCGISRQSVQLITFYFYFKEQLSII